MHKHPDADVMVSFASLRSAYDSTIEAMKFPQVRNELHHNQYSVVSQTLTTTEHETDISKTDLLCQWISIKVGLFSSLNTCTIYIYIYIYFFLQHSCACSNTTPLPSPLRNKEKIRLIVASPCRF